jgi:TniQ
MIEVWPQLTPRALPRPVTPLRLETVDSFITRLAHANHLAPRDLRAYLAGRQGCYPRPDWLAHVSGYPLPVLQHRLRGLESADRNVSRQRAHSRPMCRLCSARRGATEPVHCWLPNHVTVCHRHRRWIGPPARTWEDQRSVTQHPAVIEAAKLHHRLCRRHPPATVAVALTDARRVLLHWPRHQQLIDLIGTSARQPGPAGGQVDIHIHSYPDLVRLAGLITGHRETLLRTAGNDEHDKAVNTFLDKVMRVFELEPGAEQLWAITAWLDNQEIIARTRITTTRQSRFQATHRLCSQRNQPRR